MANRLSRAPLRNAALQSNSSRRGTHHQRRVLRLKAVGFKPHPHPRQKDSDEDEHESKEAVQQYSFKVLADMSLKQAIGDDILAENGWTQVNPRGRKLRSPVMDALEDTWNENPHEFYRVNRGIVISADSVSWDKASKTVELVFTHTDKHGVIDGAHSLAKVVDELIPKSYGPTDELEEEEDDDTDDDSSLEGQRPEPDRYLSCEVWVGLEKPEVVRLTSGRNTSRMVPPFAISNLRGDFEIVKEALVRANKEYAKKVAFKPNEHMEPIGEDDEPAYKPIYALDILQLMMCMDITNYSDTDHPIEAYKNAGYIPKFWDPNYDQNRLAEYKKMIPILGDLLELYDCLREKVPDVYDNRETHLKIPRRWNKLLAGKKGRVDKAKREPLYYLDPAGERKTYKAPTALFYPMICAFRAALVVKGDHYEWHGKKKPTAWPDNQFQDACLGLGVTIASLARKKDSLHAVGRDEGVWTACYEKLNSILLEHGIKNRRA